MGREIPAEVSRIPERDGVQEATAVFSNPSAARAWYAVGMLMLLYCVSIVDRYALALLAEPVAHSLAISDTQLGVLFGVGFGVVYSIMGLPVAQLIDRQSRVPLVAVGVVLWSTATLLSGFASGFPELMLCRTGVAVGQAVLSPAAISIIGDLFPRNQRMLPTSMYNSAAVFMSSGAFVIGGLAVSLATQMSAEMGMESWRLAFVFIGAPGILIGVLFVLTVKEPARTVEHKSEDYASVKKGAAYIWRQKTLFGWMFVGMAAVGIGSSAFIAWTPTLLIRGFGQTPSDAGYLFGAFGVVAAGIGVAAWPLLARLWDRAGRQDALMPLLAISMVATLGGIGIIGIATSLPAVLSAICVAMFGITAAALLPPLIIQNVAPGRVRGRLIAINLMASTLIGFAVGPPLTAALAEALFAGPHALGYAMTTIAAFGVLVAPAAILLARKQYVMALEEAIAREALN